MKRLFIVMLILVITTLAFGKLTPNQAYKRNAGNFSLPFAGTSAARDAVPSGVWTFRDGDFWYNTTTNTWYYYESSTWTVWTGGGGTTLQGAYDYGGAGVGRNIVANTGAVTMTKNDTGTENVLEIAASPSGSADGDGILVTLGANSTGVGIQFALGAGATNDIAGTSDTWTISKAGAAVFTTLAPTGVTTFVTDVTFDATDAGKDIEWDDSSETLHFLDNAVLGLGGATTAVGDITFLHNGTNLLIEAATQDNTPIHLGSTNAVDFVIYDNAATGTASFNSGEATLNFNAYDILMQDGDIIAFGDSDDFTMTATNTAMTLQSLTTDETSAWNFGADQDGSDIKMFGATSSTYALWDASADELSFILADLKINEGAMVEFVNVGDGATDWSIDVDVDETLQFMPVETTDDQVFAIGDATYTADLTLFGKTASTVTFDASADLVTYVNYDVLYDDDAVLKYGTGGDFTVNFTDGTPGYLTLAAAANEDVFQIGDGTVATDVLIQNTTTAGADIFWDDSGELWKFGADNIGVDVGFYGDTTGDFVLFDESGDELIVEDITVNLMDDTLLSFGDADDVTINYDEDGDDDLQIIGPVTFEGLVSAGRTVTQVDADNLTLTQAMAGQTVIFTMTGAAGTATLPEATGANIGMWFILVDANPTAGRDLSIDPEGAGTINGDGAGEKITCEIDIDGQAVYIVSTAADTWYAVLLGASAAWTEE